jgi:cytochrome bd ubiquinol oxidase subunit II
VPIRTYFYPYVLPARNPAFSLTAQSAKAADYGLRIGLIWWTVGMILAAIYFTRVYRSFSGKVKAETSGH